MDHHNDTPSGQTRLGIEFTGSGSEYFRIWIVNLLLTLLTLGLYHPWAKVRTLRYFYGNTHVGAHPLDFHGDPWRMLRGFLLVGTLLVLYSFAGKVSVDAGQVALVIVALVWPALFRASLQFRLANTSWRGLRFHFGGGMAGAYKALLPAIVPGVLFFALSLQVPDGPRPKVPHWLTLAFPLSLLAAALLAPLLWWAMKRYQHDHYGLGPWRTQLRAGAGAFYGVFLRTAGINVVMPALIAGAGMLAAFAGGAGGFTGRWKDPAQARTVFGLVMVLGAVGYLGFLILGRSFFASRMQNLVWNRTKGTRVRFESRLALRSLAWLTLKNWLLTLLTLGLYWPFAAVASARMKLEAVTVFTRTDPDELVARANPPGRDASGEAAAELVGLDVGL